MTQMMRARHYGKHGSKCARHKVQSSTHLWVLAMACNDLLGVLIISRSGHTIRKPFQRCVSWYSSDRRLIAWWLRGCQHEWQACMHPGPAAQAGALHRAPTRSSVPRQRTSATGPPSTSAQWSCVLAGMRWAWGEALPCAQGCSCGQLGKPNLVLQHVKWWQPRSLQPTAPLRAGKPAAAPARKHLMCGACC